MNALMDAQITDAEFDEAIARNKFLHECKTKGFKRLQSMGFLSGGIKLSESKPAPQHDPIDFARDGAERVNNGETIRSVCAEYGRNAGDLRYFCSKFGIQIKPTRAKRTWDYDKTYLKIRRMINGKGYRLKDVARKLECSTRLVVTVIESKGCKYNAKEIKIERIKKK